MAKKEKGLSLNSKITIITVIAIIWIICAAVLLTQCNPKDETQTEITHPHAITEEYQDEAEALSKPYEVTETSTVKNADSKTVKYFNSHFKDSYRVVIEGFSSTVDNGSAYQTIERAYSTEGYLYEKTSDSAYSELEYANSVISIATPTNSYTLYPDMKVYFKSDNGMAGFKNTINFPGEEFKTGTINILGRDFYYEEMPESQGINTKYCFDDEDNLIYRISTSQKGSVTEHYIEYSKDVDMSLFEIPEDYVLQQ